MESILQKDKKRCFLCGEPEYWNDNGMPERLEEHHVFGGSNRKHSEKYGLKVYLHGEKCHRNGKGSAHKNKAVRLALQAAAQKRFEEVHGSHEEFMRIFGKNFL